MSNEEFDEVIRKAASGFDPNLALSDMASTSILVNELYQSWIEAGFTSSQAIYLVGCIITGNPGKPPTE